MCVNLYSNIAELRMSLELRSILYGAIVTFTFFAASRHICICMNWNAPTKCTFSMHLEKRQLVWRFVSVSTSNIRIYILHTYTYSNELDVEIWNVEFVLRVR